MKDLVAEGFASDLMDWIVALDLGYVIGENFVAGQWPLDMRDLDGLLLSTVVLAQFEESADLHPTGRRWRQDRVFRFVVRESGPQQAVERAWRLLTAILNRRQFTSPRFKAVVARPAKTPSVVLRSQDGGALADFVIKLTAWNR